MSRYIKDAGIRRMEREIICIICGHKFKGDQFDECPICEWAFTGIDKSLEEDEIDDYNKISKAEAKRNFAKGLNIWGEPLKKVGFATFEAPKN